MKVTRLEFTELWKKTNDSISTSQRSLVIYVNDSALTPMNAKEMSKLDLEINHIGFMQFLNQKQFNFIITQINSQKIQRKDAFLYYKALMNADWKRLSEYVKNY